MICESGCPLFQMAVKNLWSGRTVGGGDCIFYQGNQLWIGSLRLRWVACICLIENVTLAKTRKMHINSSFMMLWDSRQLAGFELLDDFLSCVVWNWLNNNWGSRNHSANLFCWPMAKISLLNDWPKWTHLIAEFMPELCQLKFVWPTGVCWHLCSPLDKAKTLFNSASHGRAMAEPAPPFIFHQH